MFHFEIIELSDGNQVIDQTKKMPSEDLTPLQLLEYTEIERKIAIADYFRRRENRIKNRREKTVLKVLRKIACI